MSGSRNQDSAYYELFFCWRYSFFRRGASDESGFVKWMRKLDGDRYGEHYRLTERGTDCQPFVVSTDASPESSFNSVANDLESKGIWPGLFVNVGAYPRVMFRFEGQIERETMHEAILPVILSDSEGDEMEGEELKVKGNLISRNKVNAVDDNVLTKSGKIIWPAFYGNEG